MKLSTTALLFALAAAPLIGADQSRKELADSELPSLLAIYKNLHAHPELSTQEKETSAFVAQELKAAGCAVTDHLGKYASSHERGAVPVVTR